MKTSTPVIPPLARTTVLVKVALVALAVASSPLSASAAYAGCVSSVRCSFGFFIIPYIDCETSVRCEE